MVFLVMGWSAVNIEEKKKTDRRKTLKVKLKKNEEYDESQIITIHIFGFKSYFARKYNLKKRWFIPSSFIYSFYAFQDI